MREPCWRGEFFPRQCHPLTDLPLVSSTLPGGKSVRNAFISRACRPVLAENSTPCCFPGAANPTVQALLRKNAPRDVHCPGPAGPLLGENRPLACFPGPRNPLRITIRGKSPPDHPLLRCQRCFKYDDLFTHAFTLRGRKITGVFSGQVIHGRISGGNDRRRRMPAIQPRAEKKRFSGGE